jgi:hypothetical protein
VTSCLTGQFPKRHCHQQWPEFVACGHQTSICRSDEEAPPRGQNDVFGVETASELSREAAARQCRQSSHIAAHKNLRSDLVSAVPGGDKFFIGRILQHPATRTSDFAEKQCPAALRNLHSLDER